jgi:tetratricopeptide (TPR) repeat protein
MLYDRKVKAGLCLAAVFVCSIGLNHAALAETDVDRCSMASRKEAKAGLAACNRAIASKRLKGAALAQTYADRARLLGDSYSSIFAVDRAIDDYTKAIELAAKTMPDELWDYYHDRGELYENHKKDLARALEDYTAVIEHRPRSSTGYFYRSRVYAELKDYDHAIADKKMAINFGREDFEKAKSRRRDVSSAEHALYSDLVGLQRLYEAKGDFDGAIAALKEQMDVAHWEGASRGSYLEELARLYEANVDFHGASSAYSELIAANPKDDSKYYLRGLAYVLSGEPERAAADFNHMLDLVRKFPPDQKKAILPQHVFIALWLDIATQRAGKPTQLPEHLPDFDRTQWPGPIVQMFLGKVTPAALAATSDQNTACANNFFAGERAVQTGAKDEAIGFFRSAMKSCTQPYRNYAVAEMKTLGATP